MNKPVAFICASIAGIGLLILSCCLYLTIAYGHGDVEAGNFNRCHYWVERDPITGQTTRNWEEIYESTEGPPLLWLDMWFVGLGFIIVGAGIYVGARTGRRDSSRY